MIQEKKYGEYDCPGIIILYDMEEKCIATSWKNGVIVKMSWRRIRYKTLANRIHQL